VTIRPGEVTDIGGLVHSRRGSGVVGGRLVDARGRPMAHAIVLLYETARADDRRSVSTKTDEDGRFRFAGLDEELRSPMLAVHGPDGSPRMDRMPVRIGDIAMHLECPDPPMKEDPQ
jgi:hypothetical protein